MRSRGNNEPQTVDAFLTSLLTEIDSYWTTTFERDGLPLPQVRYTWIPPGRFVMSGCGVPADDRAAFYCPADDTIYVAQQFAADLYAGVLRGLPGESAGYGRAAGDFAVAYVLAHEYAHNLQQELGIFDNRVGATAKPYELQADCLAALGRTRSSSRDCSIREISPRRRTRRSRSGTSTSATPSTTARRPSGATRC